MSTNTGVAPVNETDDAEALNVKFGTITSSSALIPVANNCFNLL